MIAIILCGIAIALSCVSFAFNIETARTLKKLDALIKGDNK